MGSCCTGFRDFILRGNVIDIAVGIVIGAAFKEVVDSLVADLITPLIGVFGEIPDFTRAEFTVRGSTFHYGHFVNAVISFLLLALIVYLCVVIPANKVIGAISKTKDVEAACPHCKMMCPIDAAVCGHCTRNTDFAVKPQNSPVNIKDVTGDDAHDLNRAAKQVERFENEDIFLTEEDHRILNKTESTLKPIEPPLFLRRK